MIQSEQLVGGEWAEWYRLTPAQRWLETGKLWQTYLALGGSLDPEPYSGRGLGLSTQASNEPTK